MGTSVSNYGSVKPEFDAVWGALHVAYHVKDWEALSYSSMFLGLSTSLRGM